MVFCKDIWKKMSFHWSQHLINAENGESGLWISQFKLGTLYDCGNATQYHVNRYNKSYTANPCLMPLQRARIQLLDTFNIWLNATSFLFILGLTSLVCVARPLITLCLKLCPYSFECLTPQAATIYKKKLEHSFIYVVCMYIGCYNKARLKTKQSLILLLLLLFTCYVLGDDAAKSRRQSRRC